MQLQQALAERRTVHLYEPRPVDPEALNRAVEAAQMAPNHRLTFPWRFTQVGPATRVKIADRAVAMKQSKQDEPLKDAAVATIRGKIIDPGELMIVSCVRSDDPGQAREDYAACSCALQNFMLSLWGDGFGTKWSTGAIAFDDETYRLAGVDAANEEIIGFMWVGVPAQVPKTPKRPDLGTVWRKVD